MENPYKRFEFVSECNQNIYNLRLLRAEMRSDLPELNRSPYFKDPKETYDSRQVVDLVDSAIMLTNDFFARYRNRARA